MSGRRFALVAAFAFLVMFVATNLLANSWFKSWRLDLTANHLYSLSPGTQQVLDRLNEPVELKLFYSRDVASAAPAVQAYGARVREMLQTFAARSHGRVHFVEVNVKRFSDEEDAAVSAQIEPQQLVEGGDPLYFGLSGANAIDDKVAIPFFNPAREPFLEYEITRLIYQLENPEPVHVALITSLPIDPTAPAQPGQQGGFSIGSEMSRYMHVEKLANDFSSIPADTDVIALIHPTNLSPLQSYLIDQFIMRKGRAFIALDPASLSAAQNAAQLGMFGQSAMGDTASTLQPMLSKWGIAMTPEVVLDLEAGLGVQAQDANGQTATVPQPLFFHIDAQNGGLNRDNLMTASLSRSINFGLAGGLSWSERPGVTVTPLVKTSGHTMRMEAARALARPSPFEIMQEPAQAGRIETIALQLSGPLQSAFPDGPPPIPPPPEGVTAPPPPPAPTGPTLRQSVVPAEIVIVADTDFLSDDFYLDRQSATAAADNAAFALNAIDILGGSGSLVSLRSRAPSVRNMKLIDQMEAEAQRRIERRTQELQGDYDQTRQRLEALQARGHGSGFINGNLGAQLTSEENQEVMSLMRRRDEVRTELRHTARDLRSDVNQLEALIVFIDMWLAPLLVAAGGLFFFWRRKRRAGGGARP